MLGLLILALTVLYVIYIKTNHSRILSSRLPGDVSLPLIGNAHQLGFTLPALLGSLMYFFKKYNFDLYRIYLGPKLVVVVTNPDDVGEVLGNTSNLEKSELYDYLAPWLGEGLLTSSDKKWKSSRKIITPTFHFKILEQFSEIMEKESDKLVKKLASNSNGNIVDVWDFISMCTLDVIAETAMGVTVNAQDDSQSEIVKSIDILCAVVMNRSLNPLKQSDFLFNLSLESRRSKKALEIINNFNDEIITKRKLLLEEELLNNGNISKPTEDTEVGMKKKMAFLDMLLSATTEGRNLTNKEISDEVSTFIFTGHDTMTAGISFALFNLANYPEIQKNVLNEQLQIFGTGLVKKATFQDYQDMKYLERFIKESLRMYPSAPIIGRHVKEDYDLNGRVLPAGSSLFLFIYALHRNPRLFPNPDKFDPDRFLPENRINKHPFEYIPFSAGQRNCVGQRFANLELKIVLSKLVRNYEFTSAGPGNNIEPYIAVTLKSANGVRMRIKPRK